MSLPTPSPTIAAACLAAASLTLAACGGSGGSGTGSNAAAGEQRLVKFARCLREHGVDVSTPNSSSGGLSASSSNPQQFEAAQRACRKLMPPAQKQSLSPAEQAKRQDDALKFARCMRSHGVEVPDPQIGKGTIKIQRGKPGGLDPSSPSFQAAQKACQGLLGKFGPKAGAVTSSAGGKGPGGGGPPKAGVQMYINPGPKGG
jgi:hypothetical protein